MMNQRVLTLLVMVVCHIVFLVNASCESIIYFDEDLNAQRKDYPKSIAASKDFINNLSNKSIASFENFECSKSDYQDISISINFGNYGNATLQGIASGIKCIEDSSQTFNGAYPITGNKFFLNKATCHLNFENEQTAFGFFTTDFQIRVLKLVFEDNSGNSKTYEMPFTIPVDGGSVAFWGIIDTEFPFNKITFVLPDQGDGFGFDDFILGTKRNCNIADSDNDGVIDVFDICPETKNDLYTDKYGCTMIDNSEKIGVIDAIKALKVAAGIDNFSPVPSGFALNFNKTGYVKVAHNDDLNLSTFTLEAWVKPNSPFNNLTIVSKGNGNTHENTIYIFQIQGDKLCLHVAGSWHYSEITSINTDRWYHVATSFDDSTNQIKFYLDGLLVGTNIEDNPPYTSDTHEMFIGKQGYATRDDCNTFDGKIDELRVWSIVRTDQQIMKDKNINIHESTNGLQAYYRFDHGSGLTAYDYSGNNYHGTLTNMNHTYIWANSNEE